MALHARRACISGAIVAASTSLSPAQRTERARKAARASHSLDSYIQRVVDRAPELTPEQTDRLRAILGGVAR